MIDIPDGSVYFDCYKWGLKHVDLHDIEAAMYAAGRQLREKDVQNYWRGWYKHDLYHGEHKGMLHIPQHTESKSKSFMNLEYEDYPPHPFMRQPEILERWVPCSVDGKPLIRWSQGCLTKIDAQAWPKSRTLAENLKGTQMVIIDCDGDHDKENLDVETMLFLAQFIPLTHTLSKPVYETMDVEVGGELVTMEIPVSFHLTFLTDRVIPTMHFPKAHVDIIGNKANSLRYLKNKIWNGVQPKAMDEETWSMIKEYIRSREER